MSAGPLDRTLPRGVRHIARSRAASAAIVVAMLVIASLARFESSYQPGDGLAILFCVPVIAAALRFGPFWGVMCAVAATGIYVVWARLGTTTDVHAAGFALRGVVLGAIGAALGWTARARRRLMREQAQHAEHVALLLGQVAKVRETEHARISSDLHDFVLQGLLVSLMHVEEASADPSAKVDLATIDRLVRDAAVAVRNVIDGIEPLSSVQVTSRMLVQQAVREAERDYELAVDVEATPLVDIEDVAARQVGYRLLVEALRNAAKHSGVSRAHVRASTVDDRLVVHVQDSGAGMDPPLDVQDELSPAYGVGFNLLLERLLAAGGHFELRSAPGRGTSVAYDLPRRRPVNQSEASGQTG